MCHIAICGLPGSTVYFYDISNSMVFEKKKVIEHKMCVDFVYNFCLKHFSFYDEVSEI